MTSPHSLRVNAIKRLLHPVLICLYPDMIKSLSHRTTAFCSFNKLPPPFFSQKKFFVLKVLLCIVGNLFISFLNGATVRNMQI